MRRPRSHTCSIRQRPRFSHTLVQIGTATGSSTSVAPSRQQWLTQHTGQKECSSARARGAVSALQGAPVCCDSLMRSPRLFGGRVDANLPAAPRYAAGLPRPKRHGIRLMSLRSSFEQLRVRRHEFARPLSASGRADARRPCQCIRLACRTLLEEQLAWQSDSVHVPRVGTSRA